MKRKWIASLAILAGCSSASGQWLTGWELYGGHEYRLTTQLSWPDAEALAVSVDGHLATVNDAAENQWIADTFFPITTQITMGFFQPPGSPEPDGGWQWISGEPVTYVNWAPGAPNDWGGEEDWALMVKPTAEWVDYSGWVSVSLVERIPEPAVLSVLLVGGLALIRHRR